METGLYKFIIIIINESFTVYSRIAYLLTTFDKLAFKMQFYLWDEAIELFFSAKPLLVSAQ